MGPTQPQCDAGSPLATPAREIEPASAATPGPGQPARRVFAAGIWFSGLATFAVAPPLFVALSTLEVLQWWMTARQMV